MKASQAENWIIAMSGVLDAKVDWMHGYCNNPKLKMLVDKIPLNSDHRYEYKDGIYYSENLGFVSYFYYKSPGEGYGGREFNITMTDGTKKVLKGPWSSNSAAVNSIGFGPCVEVSITDDAMYWGRGHTVYSSAVTIEIANVAICKYLPYVFLVKDKNGVYSPSISKTEVVKPDKKQIKISGDLQLA